MLQAIFLCLIQLPPMKIKMIRKNNLLIKKHKFSQSNECIFRRHELCLLMISILFSHFLGHKLYQVTFSFFLKNHSLTLIFLMHIYLVKFYGVQRHFLSESWKCFQQISSGNFPTSLKMEKQMPRIFLKDHPLWDSITGRMYLLHQWNTSDRPWDTSELRCCESGTTQECVFCS